MRVKLSNGQTRQAPRTYGGISEEQRQIDDYFRQRFPPRKTAEQIRAECERLAEHSDEWRELWFAQHPELRAQFEAYLAERNG